MTGISTRLEHQSGAETRLRASPGLPLGPAGACLREGARASRRLGRPLDRHPDRPDAGDRAAGAARRHGCARLPHHHRPPGDQAGLHRLARPALRSHRPRAGRSAAVDRLQGADRRAAHAPRPRPRRPRRAAAAGLPDLRGGRRPGRRRDRRLRLAHRARSAQPGAGLGQLTVQPHRPGAAGRPPAQGRRLVPRAGRPAGLRRVLPGVRLGGRTGLGAPPGRQRWLPRRHPRGALAVQAVQPRRLPVRLRGR